MVMAGQHVFLSYFHGNRDEVARLRDDLMAEGERVWWDQDLLPGEDWKFAIRQALNHSYAVVLCLSKELAERSKSGVYTEALDAISLYRETQPGSIFLIPVRLSECEIPPIEIDATRTLDRLQSVDLFPETQRGRGLGRLVAALRGSPFHP